jgi:excisionase family DNA binding protein
VDKIGYSVDEACRVSGIGRSLMFEKIRSGEIVSVRVGRRRIIPADAIRAYFDRLQRSQQGDGGGAPAA